MFVGQILDSSFIGLQLTPDQADQILRILQNNNGDITNGQLLSITGRSWASDGIDLIELTYKLSCFDMSFAEANFFYNEQLAADLSLIHIY